MKIHQFLTVLMIPLLVFTTTVPVSLSGNMDHKTMDCCKTMSNDHDCCSMQTEHDDSSEETNCQGNCDMMQCTSPSTFTFTELQFTSPVFLVHQSEQLVPVNEQFIERNASKGIFRPPIVC